MTRSEFDTYIGYFNTREYENFMRYLSDDIILKFAGYEFIGKEKIRGFYQFFHAHVDETIIIHAFAGDEENVIIDVTVGVKANKKLTRPVLKENGYERLVPLEQGQAAQIPQLIHYRVENGKFKEIRCVLKDM